MLRTEEVGGTPVDIEETVYKIGPYSLVIQTNQREYDIVLFKGMPLTPKLLEKLGFLKWNAPSNNLHASAWQSPVAARFDIDWIDGKLYLKSRYDQENLPAQWMPQIKYVHQLQNLYFALCNTELKIEL